MASGYSAAGYSKPCRTIREGPVQVTYGKHSHKKRYLKAVCGGSEGMPARLQVYEDAKSASKGKSLMCEIPFTNVEYVDCIEERGKKVVTIGMRKENKSFLFCVPDSHTSTTKWFKYCGLLFAIPHYTIPKIPTENLILQQSIDKCKVSYKSVSNWVVYILSEGIGDVTGFTGLHVVTISDSTFNVYDYHTDKHLLAWDRDSIKISGCIESLVFIEVNGKCRGGPGLLWMQHPMPCAVTFQQCLHDFIFVDTDSSKRTSLACHVLVDSAMSHTYIKSSSDPHNSQSFHEEQSLDVPLPQMMQHDASQNSLDSQCSSGYCSDSSSWAGSHGGSFRLNYTRHLKGTYKQFPKGGKNQNKDDNNATKSNLPAQMISDDKLGKNSHENCFTHNHGNYENVLPLNLQKPPPLPPRTIKKTPFYENHTILHPPNGSETTKRSNSFPSTEGLTSSYCTGRSMSSTSQLQPLSPAHQSESAVSGTELPNRLLSTGGATSKHQLERIAFQKCSVVITENLDISAILPHLNSHGLLTERDRQMLLNRFLTDVDKANNLLDILPRKDPGFFETFIFCLCQSKNGTGHGNIIKALTAAMKEVKESSTFD